MAILRYANEVWHYRRFWLALARLDIQRRYRRSMLGAGWAVIQPAVMAAVMCGIFCRAFGAAFGDHFPFVLVGLCLWSYFSAMIRDGSGSIFWSETYIRQQRTPLAIYPLRIVLAGLCNLGLACAPVLLWSWLVKGAIGVEGILGLLVLTVMLFLLGWSLAILFGFATIYAPDMGPLSEIGLQLLFYATPILYRPAFLRDWGMGWLAVSNPLSGFLAAIRDIILHGNFPALDALAHAAVVTATLSGLAVLMVSRLERRVVFQL